MLEGVRRRRLALPECGVEIALLDWGGDGPLALLHHATGFCAAVWELVARPLRGRFRVIGMDARGHGDSSKPEGDESYRWPLFGDDLVRVAETLAAECGGPPLALGLGHSFGGTAMLMAAARRPGLFERLVLVDPVLPPPIAEAARLARVGGMAETARQRRALWPSREAARAKWAGKELFAAWRPEALDLYLAEALADRADGQVELKCPPAVEAAIFAHGPGVDIWQLAARVKTATLILWAERGSFPPAMHRDVASRMPDARVHALPAGHMMPM